MQTIDTIIRWPMWVGLLLSIAIHAAVLNNRSFYTAPMPQMATGRTVVQLTLLSSMNHPESTPKTVAAATLDMATLQPTTKSATTEVSQETATTEAIEQMATPIENKGVITKAVAVGTFHPAYPRISKRRGEEGTVMLTVRVLHDGSVGKADILQSSGFRRLDEAALQGALQTTFTPAIRQGRPVESTTRLSYTFRLTND